MKNLTMTVLIAAVAFAAPAFAEDAHHPDAAVSSPKAAKAGPSNMQAKEAMGKMDQQMMAMQKMHQQMMDAKTPEERNALMANHMKVMQGGMSMMSGMDTAGTNKMKGHAPSDPAAHQQMMEKRMDMMESMMQMMMDRLPAPTAK
jgi:hypothetical protein